MRKIFCVAALAAISCLSISNSLAKTPPPPKSGSGTIVLIFKDGQMRSDPWATFMGSGSMWMGKHA